MQNNTWFSPFGIAEGMMVKTSELKTEIDPWMPAESEMQVTDREEAEDRLEEQEDHELERMAESGCNFNLNYYY